MSRPITIERVDELLDALREELIYGVEPGRGVVMPATIAVNQAAPAPIYGLGGESVRKLAHVKRELADTVRMAITRTSQDFTVFEGLRTQNRQAQLVRNGMSRTLNSKHLAQTDGLSHAVDLVPWIGGKAVWDWEGCYLIACAMDEAATQLGHAKHIRWGGAWDRVLADFGGSPAAYKKEVEFYKTRHHGPDFIDGPHYEWVS